MLFRLGSVVGARFLFYFIKNYRAVLNKVGRGTGNPEFVFARPECQFNRRPRSVGFLPFEKLMLHNRAVFNGTVYQRRI